MKIEMLPKKLETGMHLSSPKHSEEILEIVMIRDGLIRLMREDGLILRGQFTRDQLVGFDYELLTDEPKKEV